jgi:hypothetical protein
MPCGNVEPGTATRRVPYVDKYCPSVVCKPLLGEHDYEMGKNYRSDLVDCRISLLRSNTSRRIESAVGLFGSGFLNRPRRPRCPCLSELASQSDMDRNEHNQQGYLLANPLEHGEGFRIFTLQLSSGKGWGMRPVNPSSPV